MEGNHTLCTEEQTPTDQTLPHMDKKATREEIQQEQGQATHQWQVGPESSPQEKREGRWAHREAGRPAHGSHHLKSSMWQLLIGWWSRFQRLPANSTAEERVAPHYINEGRGSISIISSHISQHQHNTHPSKRDVVSFSCRGLRTRGVRVWVVVRGLRVFVESLVCLLLSLYVIL